MASRRQKSFLFVIFILFFGSIILPYSSLYCKNKESADSPKEILVRCPTCPPSLSTPRSIEKEVEKEVAATHPPTDKKETENHPIVPTNLSTNVIHGKTLYKENPLVWAKVGNATFLSAYYEDRKERYGPSIVLLGYQSRRTEGGTFYCLFHYKEGDGERTLSCQSQKSVYIEMDVCNYQKEMNENKPYKYKHVFHVCRLPGSDARVPMAVSLSFAQTCEPSSTPVPVYIYRPLVKANIGVCLETPVFGKSLEEMVNFIEMQRIFGAQTITIYLLDMSTEIEEQLKRAYARDESLTLEVLHWHKGFKEKDTLHYYGEILAIHDCYYRNLHRVNYLAMLDLDEVIVSRTHSDWHQMLHEIDKDYIHSFIFINTFYLKTQDEELLKDKTTELQSYLCPGHSLPPYFLYYEKSQCRFHYYERSKFIVKPLKILDTDIHAPCRRLRETTHPLLVPHGMAVIQHYRDKPTIECKRNRKTKKYKVSYDDSLLRYGKEFLLGTKRKLCPNIN
ncbi:PREDICTED: uncharacterized protein LOC105311971 [Amphimedon queenslandica]|uniref:Glycosyltransferase family 92 protein n=1 Tax=Amphimedon queenslandica TaxID=400682 RepID=A0A1X7VBM6_AMPQE|nr:PREDICTED: uncharacterized protein LOC105311971 [Amphimedon queenslandica]|eukprot:XP_011402537.1 PREDICTED: uncharacterized protein LOC105311971 [Amphimedon queenslandica]